MEYKKENRRKYLFGLIVLLAIATATTYAWTVDETLEDTTTAYNVQTASGITVSNYSSRPIGKNKIEIKFTISGAPTTGMDVSFYNGTGTIIDVVNTDIAFKFAGSGIAHTNDDTNKLYTAATGVLGAGEVTITISCTNAYKDIDSATAGNQTFSSLFIALY